MLKAGSGLVERGAGWVGCWSVGAGSRWRRGWLVDENIGKGVGGVGGWISTRFSTSDTPGSSKARRAISSRSRGVATTPRITAVRPFISMLGEEMPTAVISFERRRCMGMFS